MVFKLFEDMFVCLFVLLIKFRVLYVLYVLLVVLYVCDYLFIVFLLMC